MPESPGDVEEARLRSLVEKLSHVLPDVQLRALRNLRQKFSAGLMSPEFLAHEAGLHKALVGLAADATRESIRGEALLFVADIFSKPGLRSCKAGLIESGLVSALSEETTQGESLAIAEDIKRAVLLLGMTTGMTSLDPMAGVDEIKASTEGCRGPGQATSYISPLMTVAPTRDEGRSLDSPPRERPHGSVLLSRPSHAAGVDSRHDAAPSRQPAEEDGEQIKDMLLSEGWCFPFIELGRANEKKLFEFQVRFGLRQDSEGLLSSCRVFRHELLEDFPPEVFLQRPQVLRQLLAIARTPHDLVPTPTPSSHASAVDAPRPSLLALESLKCLQALTLRLSASLRHHSDPSFKPPASPTVPPRGPPSQELSNMRLLRYPQRPGERVPGALSLPGFALLVMETLLPLGVWLRDDDESSVRRLSPRALALVSLLLPHLCAASTDTAPDHLEQRVMHLLHCVAPLLRNPLPGPLVLVAVRLLHLLPSPPAALPSAITDLLPHAIPHYPWLRPFLQALDPEAFAVATIAHDLLQDVNAVVCLTQHPCPPVAPFRPAMLRLQAAMPLLALLPNAGLIARGVQLWALASLQAFSSPGLVSADAAAGALMEEEDVESLGNEVVLRLLDLPLVCNRRAAYQEFARTVTVDDDEGRDGEQLGPRYMRKRLLKQVLLSEETRGLIWLIMARGLQDEDVAIKQAAWEVTRAVTTCVFDEQDEGGDPRRPVACAALELLPLLMAAREEGREEETMSIKAELMDKVIQVLLPLVPLLSPAVLLPLFSHSSAHRVSILTVLHAQLLPSLPHDAISVPLAAASSPPPRLPIAISAPSPFSPGDMKALCDLIGSSSLEPALRETAAYQLDSMLATLRKDQEGVRDAVMQAVTSLAKAGYDGLDVAASLLLVRSATLYPATPLPAVLPFLPLLFHPSGCLRFAVQSALSRSLFCNLQHWMPVSPLLQPVLGASPPTFPTLVPSPLGPLVLSLRSPSPPAHSPLIPSFLLAFKLPSLPLTSFDLHPTLLLRPTVPLPSLAPACFTPLMAALLTGWAQISWAAPDSFPSPLPALIQAPAREVNACLSALRHADSFRTFSLSLYRLHSSVCLGGGSLDALMENDTWLQAISKLLQTPPRTRRDDRLLLDALLFVENSIVPHLGPREAAILMSALDALLPVLQVAFSQGASDIGTGYEARADLCNAILGLFLSLLLHLPSPSATACATRSPLLSLLLTSLQRAQDLHSSTLRLVLALVTHLWPFAAQSLSVPLPAHVASTILRLAARHHDPEAFHGSAVTKAGLLCLRSVLCHGPSTDDEARRLWAPVPEEPDGASVQEEGRRMTALLPGPEGLFRYLSDRHTEVRALCYGCLAEVVRFPSTLSRLVDRADGDSAEQKEDGASSLVGTVLRVAADMTEPPLVAVEATRFLGALLQAHMRQVASGSPQAGRPGRWLSDARLESIITLVGEVLGARTSASNMTRVAVTLELLRWVLVVARDEGLWTGVVMEGAVYDCHLASVQLLWRPEVVGRLVRLLAEGTNLRAVFCRQVEAALGGKEAEKGAEGYFREGEAKGQDARARGWVTDLMQAALTQGGEHEVMRAQTQALQLLTLLVNEEQGAKRVLQECEGAARAVLKCLSSYAVLGAPTSAVTSATFCDEGLLEPACAETTNKHALQESASSAAYSAPHAQLLKAACGCASQLFVCADVELYLPLPSTIPLDLLLATASMLQRMDAGSPPMKQALSLLLVALAKRSFQQVLHSSESVADTLVRALWGRYVTAMTCFLAVKAPSAALDGGRAGSEDYRQILSYALSLVLVHTPAVTVNPVATEMVAYLSRRLQDLSAMLTLDDIRRHTDEIAAAGAESRQSSTTRSSATRGRRGLQALNERLAGTHGTKTPSSPVSTKAASSPTRHELTSLLGVYRSLLLVCPMARVSAARQGLSGMLLRLWPYALAAELDSPHASVGRRDTSTTTLRGPTDGDFYQASSDESMLQVMLGVVRNLLLSFPLESGAEAEGGEEECRRAVLAVTSRGEESLKNDVSSRGGDTLATLTLKVSARIDVRPEVTEAAMAVLAALALVAGGRKLFIQSPFLSNTCAPVLHKALRRQGNRMSRVSELCSLDTNSRVVLAVMKFLAHLTLSVEGQKLLVQMSGFSDLFEDLLTVLRQPSQESAFEGNSVALDMMVQVCCILRNLSFLRGIKSRVLSSTALLSFLVHSMTHPAPTVRLPSSVAVWSLLYHSEKSRGALKALSLEDTLNKAEHMASQQSEIRGGEDVWAGLQRSLSHIRALLADSAPQS